MNIRSTISSLLIMFGGAILAWFFPDIFALINKFVTAKPMLIDTPTRFLAAGFGAAISFMFNTQSIHADNFKNFSNSIGVAVEKQVNKSLEATIDKSIIPLLWDIKTKDLRNLSEISKLIDPLIKYFAGKSYGINAANSIIVQELIKSFIKKMNLLATEGLTVNLNTHLQTTQNLAGKCQEQYVQIQRHILDVNNEWSPDWRSFLKEMSKPEIGRTYILLVPQNELTSKRLKIDGIKVELIKYGFILKTYTVENLKTTYRDTPLLEYDAVEVFDETVVKTQQFVDGRYVGGTEIKMRLLEYSSNSVDSTVIKNIINNSSIWK